MVAVVAGALAGPWRPVLRTSPTPAPQPTLTPSPSPSLLPDPMQETLEALDVQPWDLSVLWQVMVGAVVLGLVYLAARWWRSHPRRRREGPPDDADLLAGDVVLGEGDVSPDLPALREGVADAGEHLRSRQRPSDAVIAAWVALEDGAARSGIVRDPASTPTEFTVAVLDRTPADPAATRVLLTLYLRARFGPEPMTADDVVAATAAVQALAATLAAEPEPEPEPERSADAERPEAGEPGPEEDAP